VTGPLAPLAAGFKSGLIDAGYRSWRPHLHLMAHLSRWLEGQGLSAADLSEERAGEYLAARRAAGYNWLCSQRGLGQLLSFLAAQGFLATGDLAPASAAEVLLARFGRYLHDERALATSTACSYLKRARRFLARCAADGDVASLTADQVTGAVLAECAAVSAGSAQYFVTALRSFLRFCYLDGLTGADLSAAALAVTARRGTGGPRKEPAPGPPSPAHRRRRGHRRLPAPGTASHLPPGGVHERVRPGQPARCAAPPPTFTATMPMSSSATALGSTRHPAGSPEGRAKLVIHEACQP